MIVDTHCHVSDRWYEPAEALLGQMDRAGVERAWLVQLLNVYDNDYQATAATAHRDRLVSIAGIDWESDGALAALEREVDRGARGVRLRPGSRSPGDDPLAIWRFAASLGLIVSCVGTAAQFAEPDFTALLRELAPMPVVLEHFGGLARPDVGDVDAAKAGIFALALCSNAYLKLPGLGQLMPRPALDPPPTQVPLIDEAIAAFGPERLLWASDSPVVSSREGYRNALDWTRAVIVEADRAAIFGGNAVRVLS